jgi:mRNA interferase RelE/StbE
VKFRIEKSFDRDVDKVKNKHVLRKLHELISAIGDAEAIRKIPQTRKIEGYGPYYRIKLGDYRLGMEAVSDTEVVLLRFLHRKDIYRYFPKRA